MQTKSTHRRSGVSLLALAILAASSPSFAQEEPAPKPPGEPTYRIDDGALVESRDGSETARVELGCEAPGQIFLVEGSRFISCEDRVVEVGEEGGTLSIVSSTPTRGRARAIALVDGKVWVWLEVQSVEVESLESLQAAARPAETSSDTPAVVKKPKQPDAPKGDRKPLADQPPPTGVVLVSEGGDVVVDLGTRDGIAVGDYLEFYVEERVELGGGASAKQERRLSVALVVAASEERSKVALGLNEAVPTGSFVREIEKAPEQRFVRAPRASDISEAQVTIRPFLALGDIGVGTMMDLVFVRRFARQMAATLRLSPLALGVNTNGSNGAMALAGFFSFDNQLFQLGLGAGVLRITVPNVPFGSGDAAEDVGKFVPMISQTARLGARDGLHLEVYNNFSLYLSEFSFESLHVQAQIPLDAVLDDTWLLLRGGGGVLLSHGFGEVGLRRLMRGNGLHDSLFVSLTVGGGGFFVITDEQDEFGTPVRNGYGGPMVGLGVEWRP